MNRGSSRAALVEDEGDYGVFGKVLVEAFARREIRLLAYCVMPKHGSTKLAEVWHLVLWPRESGEL